jgi:hypothetical protein
MKKIIKYLTAGSMVFLFSADVFSVEESVKCWSKLTEGERDESFENGGLDHFKQTVECTKNGFQQEAYSLNKFYYNFYSVHNNFIDWYTTLINQNIKRQLVRKLDHNNKNVISKNTATQNCNVVINGFCMKFGIPKQLSKVFFEKLVEKKDLECFDCNKEDKELQELSDLYTSFNNKLTGLVDKLEETFLNFFGCKSDAQNKNGEGFTVPNNLLGEYIKN